MTDELVYPDEQMCPRCFIFMSTFCNYNCEFCYYKNQLRNLDPWEKIKDQIDKMYKWGFRDFDLTGGEPTIHPDFFKTLEYIKQLKGVVSCLSNGFKLADMDFAKKAYDMGLHEVLFSLHGTSKNHDQIVGKKGAFNRIIQAIKNCQELGMLIRINCTVYNVNYNTLDEYAELINQIKPFEINFIAINYNTDNKNFKHVSEVVIAKNISKAIDLINKDILINVRYLPFCFLQGKEKYIVNYPQHYYDIYDWNPACYNPDFSMSISDCAKKLIGDTRYGNYHKFECCKMCQYNVICDGIKNNNELKNANIEVLKIKEKAASYDKKISEATNINVIQKLKRDKIRVLTKYNYREKTISIMYGVRPVPGKPITDVLHFRHGYFKKT